MRWSRDEIRVIDMKTYKRYLLKYGGHLRQNFEVDGEGRFWARHYLINKNGKALARVLRIRNQKPIPKNAIMYIKVIEDKILNDPQSVKPPKEIKRKNEK